MTESSYPPSREPGVAAGSSEFAPSYPDPTGAYPPPPQPYSGFTPPTGAANGLGIASLIIAVVALVASVSVVGGLILGGVATAMGVAARGRVKRGEATNGRFATAGIVLGSVALAVDLLVILFLAAAFVMVQIFGSSEYQHCIGEHPGDEQFCEPYR